MIKLVILDIDGVMTDGTKNYNTDGQVISKKFNDKDWTAIKKLKAAGINVCFLSGDKWNETIAKNRNVDFYLSLSEDGVLNKKQYLPILLKKYNASLNETVYVGDDYFDLEIIKELTYTFCPLDSPKDIQNSCYRILGRPGGRGCIASLVEYLESYGMIPSYDYQSVKNIDQKEKR